MQDEGSADALGYRAFTGTGRLCRTDTGCCRGREQDNGADTAEHGTDAARQRTDWSGNRTNGTGQRAPASGIREDVYLETACGAEISDFRISQKHNSDGAEDTMEAVLEQVLPCVVQIYHGTPEGGHTAGSGFIMEMTDDTVYLCTNRHVIAKYDDWDVYFYDGTCVTGSKAGTDDVYDVGVVAVDRTAIPKEVQEKLKTVSYDLSSWEELGNAELPVGIVRIGQEGNVLHTLTGSLLRKETEFLWGQGEKETEVRMAITDGDSGSAVFDENGKLVSMIFGCSQDAGGERDWGVPLRAIVSCYEKITGET